MLDDALFAVALLVLCWNAIGLINRWFELKRHGFTVSPGYVMWRTERGLGFIDRTAGLSRRGWIAYGTLAAAAGFMMMAFIFVMLLANLIIMLTTPIRAPGVMLVYPGLIPWLPIAPWLIAVGLLLVVHEFSHGIMLRAHGLRTRSVGAMVLVVLFGAFVEPDEKQLEASAPSKRMRVYAAGSVANVLLAFVSLGLILLLLSPKPGVYIWASAENYVDNFPPGARLCSINGHSIENFDDYYAAIEGLSAGDRIYAVVDGREVSGVLMGRTENENSTFLPVILASAPDTFNFINPLYVAGVAMAELVGSPVFHPYIYQAHAPWWLIDVLKWIFILNLGVGLFNMLPAVPLDGGYMLRALLECRMSKRSAARITKILSFVILFLIIANFIPSFLR
ncbi:MAG: site-2 protease family protein [Candidatus Hadarchaeales archaeon]